jgi:murein L,D-transpeptidase YcbB/YkuD
MSYALVMVAARADDHPFVTTVKTTAAAAFPEPDLPPDIDETPTGALSTSAPAKAEVPKAEPATPAPTAQSASPDEASLIDSEKTDPEAALPSSGLAGATPNDIAAAILALPPTDSKKSPIASLTKWNAARDAIDRFYAWRGDMPIWTDGKGFSPAGRAVIGRLERAGEDGLDLSNLAIPNANETIETPGRLAEAEVTLSEAIVVYAFQASGGRIEPTRISPLITAKAEVIEPDRALEAVSTAADPDAALASFNPPQNGYRELRERLAELRSAYPTTALNVLHHAEDAPLIRARFEAESGHEKGERAAIFSRVAAVTLDSHRQNASTSEGSLDPSMTQALAGRSPRALEASILANMEMWRWEPRDMGEERIEVNVPDFSLRVLRGEEALHTARIIVGKPDTQTPIFSNAMRYILVNPYWSVPVSIIKKEMLPKLAEDPDYLTRLGYEVTKHGDTISVKQPPGEKNALGRIAFMFPNEHSVYLHDTPSRGLFSASRRAFSHGCVRVDQPMQLAEIVMGQGWSEQRLRSLIDAGAERTVFLPRPLPIHIEYFTAFVDATGSLQIRDDLYGHMRRVESALGLDAQSG